MSGSSGKRGRAGHGAPGATWYLYVLRTADGSLYAGITTNVRRRYREHVTGSPRAARFTRAKPPVALALKRRIGSQSRALKVEYGFKQLPKKAKEAIIAAGRLRLDPESGRILAPGRPRRRPAARASAAEGG